MLNKVQVIGRLGADPELKNMPSGDAVCNLSVATSERWKDKNSGEMREETEWHRITLFGRVAEIAGQYLRKGSLAYFEGKLKTRKYQAQDGTDRYVTELHAREMKMLGGNEGGGQGGQQQGGQNQYRQQSQSSSAPAQQQAGGQFDNFDDDIPF